MTLEMRILVVEDERTLAGFIEQSLGAEGYAVTVAHDGEHGELEALTGDYGLVLLDVMLPGKNGLEVLDAIRARKPELPVIVLTARGAIEQQVEGLDRGANDYVTKPFSFEELLARVRAQLRQPSQREASVLEAGDMRLDLRTRRVERDGREVKLTAREFELLAYLARHPDQVLSREQILNAVWGYDFDPGTKVLEVYIGYLRRKLGAGEDGGPIETVRNVGYRLRAPRERRLVPGGLRAQLALAIALITALALGLTFLAVYRGTGSRLRDRIDEDLRTQVAEWEQLRAGADLSTPAAVERTARRFIAAQRYHPASRIFVIDVAGGTPVTNQPRILQRELEDDDEAQATSGARRDRRRARSRHRRRARGRAHARPHGTDR